MDNAMNNPGTGLLLLRHGESTWNVSRLWQGWADPPLSDRGTEGARALVWELKDFAFAAVFSSDLSRAHQTAAVLADGLNLAKPTVDARLRERDVGEWAGLSDDEIEARWPGKLASWRTLDDDAPAGGGEESDGVVTRVRLCLLDIWARCRGQNALVVSHAGAIRAMDKALGGAGGHIPNLAGRWILCDGKALGRGETFDVGVGEPTGPGRL